MHRDIKVFSFAAEELYQLFGALVHHFTNTRFAVYHLLRFVNKAKLGDIVLCAPDFDQSDRALIICVVELCQMVNNELSIVNR